MTYIHVTKTPDSTLSEYHRVVAAIGEAPITGRRRHVAAEEGGALYVFDEWDSRADADHFAAERLFPAFERAGVTPTATTVILAFDAGDHDA